MPPRLKLPVLASLGLWKESKIIDVVEHPQWEMILDSGAFTNWSTGKDVVTIDGYIHFLSNLVPMESPDSLLSIGTKLSV